MIMQRTVSMCVLLATLVPAAAMAKTINGIPVRRSIHLVEPLRLADVVVNPTPPAPAPVSAPAPTYVQAPPSHSTAYVEHGEHRSYMSTIALNALMGGLAGFLVGGSIYFLADDHNHARRIAYWAAGGVLVGTTVGVVEVATEESRADRAVASHLPVDPAPTVRLALFSQSF